MLNLQKKILAIPTGTYLHVMIVYDKVSCTYSLDLVLLLLDFVLCKRQISILYHWVISRICFYIQMLALPLTREQPNKCTLPAPHDFQIAFNNWICML